MKKILNVFAALAGLIIAIIVIPIIVICEFLEPKKEDSTFDSTHEAYLTICEALKNSAINEFEARGIVEAAIKEVYNK